MPTNIFVLGLESKANLVGLPPFKMLITSFVSIKFYMIHNHSRDNDGI
jgi:hypothetical protein